MDAILSRPLRLALLSFLTLARPTGTQRRGRLADVFWPEKPQESARHSLSQTLYELRRCLSASVIVTRGSEEVWVDGSALTSDVGDFWRSMDEGHLAAVVNTYRTPLLQHFHLRQAPEFNWWLDDERRVITDAAFRSACQLVDSALDKGDLPRAVEWANAALRIQPLSEAVTKWIMILLALEGRRIDALRRFQVFCTFLKQDLDMAPSPELVELATRIRSGLPVSKGLAQIRSSDVPTLRFV